MDTRKRSYDVVVIGGGAAGFFGALTCAEFNPAAQILILEKGRMLLSKVLVSGGGRCNVTHACFDTSQLISNYPRGGKALRGPFTRFQPQNTIEWFRKRGVKLKTEADGRMFPVSDSSETIKNCFIQEAKKSNIEIQIQSPVGKIDELSNGFQITLQNQEQIRAKKVLVATGGNTKALPMFAAMGHTIISPVPSLFTFKISDPRIKNLSGVSMEDVELSLPGRKLKQRGPILITHWGLSGPAVLKLSAWGARFLHKENYSTALQINWLPDFHQDSLYQAYLEEKQKPGKQMIKTYDPVGIIPKRLWKQLIHSAEIDEEKRWQDCSKRELNNLAREITQCQLQIQGKGEFKEEFVTCGGIKLGEINFKTMESKICSGLYFAGEVLDIDAITGGFNFQNAWTTGWIAGKAIAKAIL